MKTTNVLITGHGTRPERLEAYRAGAAALAPTYRETDDPAHADLILMAEPGNNRFRDWISVLEADQLISSYPEKCITYDFSDRAVDFLPGLYPSVPARRVNGLMAVPADFWWDLGGPIEDELLATARSPQLLFSFRGFRSAEVRGRLFDLDLAGVPASVEETFRWRNYGDSDADDERRRFVEEMYDSAFVLCPRGRAPTTDRIYEAMYFGRVPVIISDEISLSADVPWQEFSVRVPENEVERLPAILLNRQAEAARMGAAARRAWLHFMQPGPALMKRMLDSAMHLRQRREDAGLDGSELRRRWHSASFQWRNGIHPLQGAYARIKPRRQKT